MIAAIEQRTNAELRTLAELLDIPHKKSTPKKSLIGLIVAHKARKKHTPKNPRCCHDKDTHCPKTGRLYNFCAYCGTALSLEGKVMLLEMTLENGPALWSYVERRR